MQGFINIYKPSGKTSNQVVVEVKKKFNINKVGHMGTLDPMAEGVLPIAIGKATRMFDYFLSKLKSYRLKMKFGISTDTLDITGNVLSTSDYMPTLDNIKKVLPTLVGNIKQTPPLYSAKNVNGVRAYKLARAGKTVELKSCDVYIKSIDIVGYDAGELTLDCTCGSGTYIRSLVRDISTALDTVATMTYLCRTNSGYFDVSSAVDIFDYTGKLEDILIPITQVFDWIPTVDVNKLQSTRLCHGLTQPCNKPDGLYFVKCDSELIGVANVQSKLMKIKTYLKED